MPSVIQRAFAAGELGPSLYARADTAAFQSGLKTCRNFIVMRHGGVTNRSGSQFIAEVKDSSVRTYFARFVFNDAETYVIEMGNLYFRFYDDGAQSSVSSFVQPWSAATNYLQGYSAKQGGISYYCILDHINQIPPNAAYWHPLTDDIYEIPTPYAAADLERLKFTHSGDILTITHPSYAPMELRRYSDRLTLTTFVTTPSLAAPASPGATNGTAGAIVWRYKVTSVQADTYEESLPTSSFSCTGGDPTDVAPNALSWTAVSGAVEYNVYREIVPGNGVYGFIGVAASNAFNDPFIMPDESETPPVARSLFASADNYPAAAAHYQQRMVFGGTNTKPEGVEASRTGRFTNFTISSPIQDDDAISFRVAGRKANEIRHLIGMEQLVALTSSGEWVVTGDQDGVLRPTAINAKQTGHNGISDVPPIVVGHVVIYLQSRNNILRDFRLELVDNPDHGRDLTVFSPHLVEGYTIERMDFALIPHSIVWLVRSDGSLLGLTYLPESEVWGWHRHDTDGVYEDVAVVPEGLEDAVYVIVKRTINGQTKRYVERFASRRFTDMAVDALFLDSYLTYDGRNTTATTVTLTGAAWTPNDLITVTASGSVFVAGDVGNAVVARLNGETVRVTITAYTSGAIVQGYPDKDVPVALRGASTADWDRAVDDLGGLDHLEGKTVSILADGNVLAQEVVSAGVVTLPRAYSVIHAGLAIEAEIQTLDLDVVNANIRDRKKRVGSISMVVESTRGLFAGPDGDNLFEMQPDSILNYADPLTLVTDTIELNIQSTWEGRGSVLIRQSDPLPATILAVIPNVEIGG